MLDRKEGEYKYDIAEACDLIFGDLSNHVKYRVLGFYSPEDAQKQIDKMKKGAARSAMMLINDPKAQQ